MTSIWDPSESFACGPFVGKNHAIVIQEEPQDLDSVSAVLDFIQNENTRANSLLFVGGKTKFTDLDKVILAKAIVSKAKLSPK